MLNCCHKFVRCLAPHKVTAAILDRRKSSFAFCTLAKANGADAGSCNAGTVEIRLQNHEVSLTYCAAFAEVQLRSHTVIRADARRW